MEDKKLALPTLTLASICGGAAEELFEYELNKVLSNIADVNTDAEKKRSISLTFTFTPFENREGAQVSFTVTSKECPTKTVKSQFFMARGADGKVSAFTSDPRQTKLFQPEEAEDPAKVRQMGRAS